MQIYFSENESKQLNLRVGRARIESALNVDMLRSQIMELNLDLVKMKVNALQQNIFQQLDQMGFPYFVNSILYRNQIDYTNTTPEILPDGYSYELYTETNRQDFQNMLAEIFDNTTGINYSIPLYRMLVNPDTEKKMAINYYLEFDHSQNSGKAVWLLKEGNEFIGFVCGQFLPNGFEGIWYGVLPKYRTRGLSSLLITIIHIECRKRNVNQFFNDVQYQNIFSQLNVMRNGAVPVGTYLNVFILPAISLVTKKGTLLNNTEALTVKEIIKETFGQHTEGSNWQTSYWQLSEIIPTHYRKLMLGERSEICIYNFYNEQQLIAQYKAVCHFTAT